MSQITGFCLSVTDFIVDLIKSTGLCRKFLSAAVVIPVSVFLLTGCEIDSLKGDDDTKAAERYTGWNNNEYFFRQSKILLNSSAMDGNMYVAGLFILSRFEDDSITSAYNISPGCDDSLNYKPAMYGHYAMYRYKEAGLVINSGLYQDDSMGPFTRYIGLKDLDAAITDNAHICVSWYTDHIGAFNNKDQFITYIDDPVDNTIGVNGSICLITLNSVIDSSSFETSVKISPVMKRIPNPTDYSSSLRYIGSFGDMFYIHVDGDLMVIDSEGNVTHNTSMYGVREMFSYRDVLYAVCGSWGIQRSYDGGFTWEVYAEEFIPYLTRFFVIDDKLCFHVYSQLFQLDIDTGEITELDNTGLQGFDITSVNEFEGRVWITTLSGLFYKDKPDFFIEKAANSSKSRVTLKNINRLKIITKI